MSIVIPAKNPETEVLRLQSSMERPYAIWRGRGRTHIPFIALATLYIVREFNSTNFHGFGQKTRNVACISQGHDQKTDDEGRGLFEFGKRIFSRGGTVKDPKWFEKGKPLDVDKLDAEDPEWSSKLIPIPLSDAITDGPIMKATWGTPKNIADTKKTAEDSLAMSAYEGFPMMVNTWVDGNGKVQTGKDKVCWDRVTGIESVLAWPLKHHLELTESPEYPVLKAIVDSIPFASDSQHRKAEKAAQPTVVAAAAANAKGDPFT